ncbi:MAG: Ig-like domain-containing protein [Candidatus Wallbacteria bacterium]|nr:Ig-like domain-containing protein [Candidatus Wallbacteria bacterium]
MKTQLILLILIAACGLCLAADPSASSVLPTGYAPKNPDLALTQDGTIELVFESSKGTSAQEIFFTESTNEGRTWSTPVPISIDDSHSAAKPRIAVYQNEAHAIWQEKPGNVYEIYYSRKSGIGSSWTAPVIVSNTDEVTSQNPGIAVFRKNVANNVCVVWEDSRNGGIPEIYYNQFNHLEDVTVPNPLPNKIRLSQVNGSPSTAPAITADLSSNLSCFHVAWTDNRSGQNEIYYSSIGGSVLIETMISTDDSAVSQFPSLAASSSSLQIVWDDYKYFGLNGTDLFTRSYSLTGVAGQKQELVKNTANSTASSIISDKDGNFHLVWQDDRNGNYEIYYMKKDNVGWSSQIRLTQNSENATHPVAVAAPYPTEAGTYPSFAGTGVYIVWQESSNLYYIHLPAGGASVNTPTAVINPLNGETGIAPAVIPSATYTRELDVATVTANTVKLFEDTSSVQVNGAVSLSTDKKKISFYPQTTLKYGTTYRFELTSAITDTQGNMSVAYVCRFTTVSPEAGQPGQGLKLSAVKPYRQGTSIAFSYKLNFDPADSITSVIIKIYSMNGRLMKKIDNADKVGVECTTVWDGVNRFNDRIANGIYFYTISASTDSGKHDEYKGKFLVAD